MCLDDKNGILFNKRRQSRDREVIRKIVDITNGQALYISEYSKSLFSEFVNCVCVISDFTSVEDGFCFVEAGIENIAVDSVSELYLFKWNRIYPCDTWFPTEQIISKMKHLKTLDFKGNSHKKITLEVYEK